MTAAGSGTGPGPLDGYRVVDLTQARAGPVCTRQLADLGAEVVSIGHPGRGDLVGADRWNLTRNKRSVLLDLARPEGREVFLELCRSCDVLVENFRPAVKHRLRIGPEDVWKVNERLVYGSISGFGQTGPYADRPGVDQIAQGMGGIMSVTGPPGSGPWRAGIAVSDMAAGTLLTQGVLAALLERERTGRAQWVHTSVLEAMLNFMDFQAVRWPNGEGCPGQVGNDHPTVVPMGCFRTGDGYVNLAALSDWETFCDAVEALELVDDERFATPGARLENRDALRQEIEGRMQQQPTAYWVDRLVEAGLPAGPVYRLDEVFSDPQIAHLAPTQMVEGADGRQITVLGYPVTLTETPAAIRRGVPASGADTLEVLADLGLDSEEVHRLIESGVAATGSTGRGWSG